MIMLTNLQVQDVYVVVLLVEKQSTWTFWWGIQLNLRITFVATEVFESFESTSKI